MKTLEQIKELLQSPAELVKEIKSVGAKSNWSELKKEYEPLQHDVHDLVVRPNKIVKSDKGTKEVQVARISVNHQKRIVAMTTAFLFTNAVEYKTTKSKKQNKYSDIVLEMIRYLLKKNKEASLNKTIANMLFSETEVAEYWYAVEDISFWERFDFDAEIKSKNRLRCRLFAQSYGDTLYPYFDEYDDLIAFGRGYKLLDGKTEVEHLDLFTSEIIATYVHDKTAGWILKEEPKPNLLKKIPIVYYSQPAAEWSDVQTSIKRIETLISNFADTNDYFGSPMLKVIGDVKGFAEKGEQGKVFQLTKEADVEYLTWDQAPEAIKLEFEILKNIIFSGTQTPDISFDSIKGMSNISGIVLKLMFLDSYLKAVNKQEIFDEAFQRRLSILKTYCGLFNVGIKNDVDKIELECVITPFIPSNDKDLVDLLYMATGGKPILSQKSAVGLSRLVPDESGEFEQIEKEAKNDAIRNIGETAI